MSDDRLARVLDEGIARLKTGDGVDDIVGGVDPALAAELRPLLDAAASLHEAGPEAFPEDARRLNRARVMREIGGAEAVSTPRRRPLLRLRPSWEQALLGAAVAAAVVLGLSVGVRTSQAPDGAEAATILTVLQGEVRVSSGAETLLVRRTAQLRPGDRIVTGAGTRAVLTFLDGSTVTLEPDTEVVIDSVLDQQGSVRVRLTQERGNTWTHVPPELGSRDIKIETPTGSVQTNEAAFATSVEPASGRTQVDAGSGSIQVSSGNTSAEVTGGTTASIDAAGKVAPAAPSRPPPRALIVRITGPASGFVTDPNGATVGVLTPAYQVSQISGAEVTREGTTLVIRIPEPVSGAYEIGIHGAADGTVQVASSAGSSNDLASFAVGKGEDWRLHLTVDAQSLALARPALVASAAAARPANVAVPDRVIAAATAVAVNPEPTRTPAPSNTPAPTATPTTLPATSTPVRAVTPISIGPAPRSIDATVDDTAP